MQRLVALATARPRAVLAIAAVLAALGAWLGAFQLRIDSDTDSLILESRPYMRAYRAFLAEFGDLEGAIIAESCRFSIAAPGERSPTPTTMLDSNEASSASSSATMRRQRSS